MVLLGIGLSGCSTPSWKDWAQYGPVLSPTYRSAPVISAGSANEDESGPAVLAGMLAGVLSRESIERRGLFRWEAIEKTIAAHAKNKEDHTDHLLALMNLELWCRIYLDGDAPDAIAAQLMAEAVS